VKNSSTFTKLFAVVMVIATFFFVAFVSFLLYQRNLNAKLETCLSQIELGDTTAEIILKINPYRKAPDRVLKSQTVYLWQTEREGYTLLIYDALFGDSGGHIFYFPPENDRLIYFGLE